MKKPMKRLIALTSAILLLGGSIGPTTAEGTNAEANKAEAKQEIKREEIDVMAKEAVDRVIAESEGAKNLQKKAVGYAVFDNLKFTLLLGSAGGGVGVAVDKATGKRTYMKMATGGPGARAGRSEVPDRLLLRDPRGPEELRGEGLPGRGRDECRGRQGGSQRGSDLP